MRKTTWGCEKSLPCVLESNDFLRYSVVFMHGTAAFSQTQPIGEGSDYMTVISYDI